MIEVSLKDGFSRMERALARVSGQLPYATARSLNDVARAAQADVNGAMPRVFDRPTKFTDRAAVAPRALAAEKDNLAATVTLRPIQAKYLLREEVGGTRTPADNTRRPGAQAIVLPGRGLLLDGHGNIPTGTLRQLRQDAKPASQRRARKGKAVAQPVPPAINGDAKSIVFLPRGALAARGISGYFARLTGGRLRRLTAFEPTTQYHARMGYHARVQAVAAAQWVATFRRRLLEAVTTAR